MGKKVGFFGGTFDPPHCGHALLAKYAFEQADLDELLWVLTPLSPFKDQVHSTLEQRIKMVELSVSQQPFSRLSRVEIDRDPPYYTLDTAKRLRSQLSVDDELYFVLGGDSLRYFPKWRGASELIFEVLSGLVVARRPGDDLDLTRTENALPGISKKLTFVNMKTLNIASREIRNKIQKSIPVDRELIPEVISYIKENHIYKNPAGSKESE